MAISNNTTGLRTGVCTSTTRPTNPYEGQMIYETDTDLTYIWNGSAFYQVSGSTAVGNSGLVFVASGALSGSSTNFVGCFSSTFDNYRVLVDSSTVSSAGDFYLKYLTTGTTPATGNNYYWSYRGINGNGGSEDISANAAGAAYLGWSATGTGGQGGAFFDISNPNKAFSTFTSGQSFLLGSGTYASRAGSVAWDGNNIFTGFQITTLGAVTMTGNVNIYGYRKA